MRSIKNKHQRTLTDKASKLLPDLQVHNLYKQFSEITAINNVESNLFFGSAF